MVDASITVIFYCKLYLNGFQNGDSEYFKKLNEIIEQEYLDQFQYVKEYLKKIPLCSTLSTGCIVL